MMRDVLHRVKAKIAKTIHKITYVCKKKKKRLSTNANADKAAIIDVFMVS